VKCDANASPADTLKAYNKALEFRNRIMKGEDFAAVAKGKDGSDDPSAKDNGGDLGYFSAFDMVYPFEKAAFETPVGQLSMPIRTKYGYHIVKPVATRPSRGEVHVAHIMIREKKEPNGAANAEKAIREIHEKLKQGELFEDLASKHSEDASSNKKGGELPWFGANKMVMEFEEASFALKNDGDFSEPFKTSYGWHIVKRLGHKPVQDFKTSEKELKSKVSKDSRSELTRASFIEKLKKDYKYKFMEKTLAPLIAVADSGVYEGQIKSVEGESKVLFQFAGKKYPLSDYTNYLKTRTGVRSKLAPKEYVRSEAIRYAEGKLLDYEDKQLEGKYTAFRLLMNEYREGILLFELTDQKVWGKAVKDSVGLENFYNENKDRFMWARRLDCTIYTCTNADVASKVRSMVAEGKDKVAIAAAVNETSQLNLQVEAGVFAAEDKDVLSKIDWKKGLSKNVDNNGQIVIVDVKDILEPSPKKLSEARGMIASEYQNYLEQEWIKELRAKHKIQVNKEVLYSIK
jgi:peptidyl-prolyl cis-trans isomerase SurA